MIGEKSPFAEWLLRIVACLPLLAGCAVNPVTGERELRLIGESQEITLGRENYGPLRQATGGDLVVDPALNRYVAEVGQRVASHSARSDLPYEFVVVNNSVPNAWALPGGKIAINRGLLAELDNEAELAAVLGHEVVHADARHSAQRMERGLLVQAGVAAVGIGTADARHAELIGGAAMVGAMLLTQRYSREAELEADRYGMRYMHAAGYDPAAAVSLQETFIRLAEGRSSNWLEGLFASHPPSRERAEANRRIAGRLGGGVLEQDRFRERTAYLRRSARAYATYDAGVKALEQHEAGTAADAARRAIALEPREALFHGLLADALAARREWRDAAAAYARALELNDGYFAFHLGAGFAARALGDRAGAIRALERSTALLPTAAAHLALGEIHLEAGRRDRAVADLRVAAQSEGPDGDRARALLATLEV